MITHAELYLYTLVIIGVAIVCALWRKNKYDRLTD